jgi:hypothetical protein
MAKAGDLVEQSFSFVYTFSREARAEGLGAKGGPQKLETTVDLPLPAQKQGGVETESRTC